jgi:patatin-related protein
VQDPPRFVSEQEFRYALVLYGGVSLAVYINGVVQEFFRLVRSTAPVWPPASEPEGQRAWFPLEPGGRGSVEPLRGSERVYRRLGQLLPGSEDVPRDAPIRTRFVVDILSGSSAGGINGIFLAKALANRQSIDELRDLWVDEGDIALLLNDQRSYADLDAPRALGQQRPPRSLLNGYRLFVRALQALQRMNGTEQGPVGDVSPSYAEQVDLVVTATDLQGLRMPIKLYDNVVHEARHKHVFRMAYWTKEATGITRNDFVPDNDPLLAFAARCTSSFPFAFEPMVLDDLADVLPASQYPPASGVWPQFFSDYTRAKAEYRGYAFADGGYLDNKPFSHATEQLVRRRADIPVERRLVYIEPDPSQALPADATAEDPKDRPEVLANIQAAAMGLPRTETIREDIDAVVRRSRAVARAREITRSVVDSIDETGPDAAPEVTPAYWALRRRIVLDEIAEAIARAVGVGEDSDAQYALQLVVSAWADQSDITNDDLDRNFDLGFRLRRLVFLQRRINDMLREEGAPEDDLRRLKLGLNEVYVELRWRGRGVRAPLRTVASLEQSGAESATASAEAGRFRGVAESIAALGLTQAELLAAILDPGDGTVRSDDAARARAAQFAGSRLEELARIAATLRAVFALSFEAAEAAVDALLGPASDAQEAARGAEAAAEANRWLLPVGPDAESPTLLEGLDAPGEFRARLRGTYDAFERIDAMLLPLTYPDLGEVNPVDIVRISPQDATSLIREPVQGQRGRRKLAGTTFHHFGGFLDRRFRVNDILWGRLDGAERIIGTTLPPGHPEAPKLVEAAQLAIIDEDLLTGDREPWVTSALAHPDPRMPRSGASSEDLCELLGWDAQRLEAALKVEHHLATEYEPPTEPERRAMLDVVGRSTSIASEIVGAAADSVTSLKSPMAWAGRSGRLLTGLAALATQPREGYLARLVFRNVAVIVLLVGLVLIVLGILGLEGASRAGWLVLAVTAIAQVAVWAATAWVGAPTRVPGKRWPRLWRWIVRALVAVVAVLLVWAAIRGIADVIDWID